MGSKRDWLIICVMFNAWLWPLVQGSDNYSRDSLDSFLYSYALDELPRLRTRRVYSVHLLANFSGMEFSMVRLRAHNLWMKGFNYSSFVIPPLVLPYPFTERLDIVYQNLGNWSSSYYTVPNYTFVAPVLGFLAYNPNRCSESYGLIELEGMGNDPFTVRFPNVSVPGGGNVVVKCVRFDKNGTLEFSNITAERSCVVRRQGHFSVVVPYPQPEKESEGKKPGRLEIAAGVLGLVLLVVVVAVSYKWIKGKRIEKMIRRSERSEALEPIWIGRSRMPSAPGIRTPPVIEDSYVP